MKIFKKILMQLLVAIAVLNADTAAAAVINLNLTGPAQTGAYFTVEVWAHDLFSGLPSDDELLAFGMRVVNNSPGLFSLSSVNIAPAFVDDSALLTLDAAGSAFPGISNSAGNQSLLLATLSFFANSAGTGSLGVSSDLFDLNQGLIFFQNGAVNINANLTVNVSAVPLPAALPLLLGGMGLLAGAGVTCRHNGNSGRPCIRRFFKQPDYGFLFNRQPRITPSSNIL